MKPRLVRFSRATFGGFVTACAVAALCMAQVTAQPGPVAPATALPSPSAAMAGLREAEALQQAGKHAEALVAARALAAQPNRPLAARGVMLAADILVATGRRAEAITMVDAAMATNPDQGLRYKRGILAQRAGDLATARKVFGFFIAESDAGRIDLQDPRALLYLAQAARYTGEYQLANDALKEAWKLDRNDAEIALVWAEVFNQKYASALAVATLEEALAVQPDHPDLLAAMAGSALAERYDLAAAYDLIEKALRGNPRHEHALLVRASIEIDKNQWEAAQQTLASVLKTNPESLEALSYAATVAWVRDQPLGYETHKKRVLALNPAYADFYRTVARSAEREHRYAAAVELLKTGLALVPGYAELEADIGLGYLRLGDEAEGMKWLQKAWQGDPYNVRTYNTLELYDETIKQEYVTRLSPSFRFRFHRDEAAVLSRYIEPTLERAFASMSKRYGFVPKTPVVIELYADRQDYAIRTVGLPDLGALGVCFGQVITAISPTHGDLNWGMVLWHELAHVFAVQLSNSRVPRWYTEGLSEYETLIVRPEWRRENDAELYAAMVHGTLPSVAELNHRFMQPDVDGVVVAYYLSAVTIEYIVNTYGFDKIVQGLRLFGKGQETPEVIAAITSRSVAQFDREFRTYLEKRLAPYKGSFVLPRKPTTALEVLKAEASAAPRDVAKQEALTAAYYYAGDAPSAEAAARATLALRGTSAVALFVLGEVAMAAEDAPTASRHFGALVKAGHDGALVRLRLAEIARALGETDQVAVQLAAAKAFDPEDSGPYQQLADAFFKQGDKARAAAELGHYVMLEQMEIAPLKRLMTIHSELGQWARVVTYGEMAMFIAPLDAEVLMMLGAAYVAEKKGAPALYTYDTVLALKATVRRPALAHVGRAQALRLLGKLADAKAAAAEALRLEPDNAEALKLR
ncbi:MAG: tetratricopeptide repeat protein [Myxococcales bacterium]|nr:tetratricopeptide repeat protein [Myxococcales bacterium]